MAPTTGAGGPADTPPSTPVPASAPASSAEDRTHQDLPRPLPTQALAAADGHDNDGTVGEDEPGFHAGKAAAYLARLSTLDLRDFLKLLEVRGKMQSNNTAERGAIRDVMQRRNLSDLAFETMVDDAAAKDTSCPSSGNSSNTESTSGPAGPDPPTDPSASSPRRDPHFTVIDIARIFHVVADPAHYDGL